MRIEFGLFWSNGYARKGLGFIFYKSDWEEFIVLDLFIYNKIHWRIK